MKKKLAIALVLLAVLASALISVAYTFPPCKLYPRSPTCVLCGPGSTDPRCPTARWMP